MKLKKFKFGLILILSVFAFSCASTPKIQDETVNTEIPQEEVTSGQEAGSSESEDAPSSSENEGSDEDLQNEIQQEDEIPSEKVTPDELEVLPELEKEPEEVFAEPELEAEPEVQDAEPEQEQPDTAVNAENQDGVSADRNSSYADGIQETLESPAEPSGAENTENRESSSDAESNAKNADSETNADFTEQEEEKPSVKKEISPSRSVTIGKNQLINIVYPGKGWIYQGNIDEEGNIDSRNRNFIFGGRKLGTENYTFTLRSRTAGKFLLHFFKNDGLTGDYIDDYLEVIVDESKTSMPDAITVPSYAETVPPKVSITADKIKEEQKRRLREQKEAEELARQAQEKSQESSKSEKTSAGMTEISSEQEKISTTIQTNGKQQEPAPSVAPVSSGSTAAAAVNRDSSQKPREISKADDYSEQSLEKMNESALLKTASKLYDSKDFENALKVITKFFDKASGKIDEGLYLQGQILEAKSPVQNIKDAIESYDLVVKNYPASPFWEKARNRKTFLQRFYINIR